jgi:hypothetical protein
MDEEWFHRSRNVFGVSQDSEKLTQSLLGLVGDPTATLLPKTNALTNHPNGLR